jgi:hypothetical protein
MFYIRHPNGFVVDGSPVNALGPFPSWHDAHMFYYSPAFPRERDGLSSLEVIRSPDA